MCTVQESLRKKNATPLQVRLQSACVYSELLRGEESRQSPRCSCRKEKGGDLGLRSILALSNRQIMEFFWRKTEQTILSSVSNGNGDSKIKKKIKKIFVFSTKESPVEKKELNSLSSEFQRKQLKFRIPKWQF